jgi:hypothetical protein
VEVLQVGVVQQVLAQAVQEEEPEVAALVGQEVVGPMGVQEHLNSLMED